MNTKNLVILALLAGIGVVLHTIMPASLSIKPDMMLAMMFLGIILVPEIKSVMLMAIVTGILTALTTAFPGGQIPNIIDKPITALVFFGLFLALKKFRYSIISVGILTAVGTLVSGTVFLTAAYFIVGLPGPFTAIFAVGVLPAIVINTVVMVIVYPVAQSIFKRTKISSGSVIQK
ncbi:tryptophan transporter [Neobacillus mesonae]|uniref:Tryptophan transporter n=1 Tax=Neobacillus mesonae TaxID=1193713 RepID=A0A3T0HVP9_9BACI|nr:tryptophan transporter [Neobacillus mesonae]AZU61185.1 tryptophan transporter [Neobacillus mesonae]